MKARGPKKFGEFLNQLANPGKVDVAPEEPSEWDRGLQKAGERYFLPQS